LWNKYYNRKIVIKLIFDEDIKDLPIVTSPVLFVSKDKPHPQGIFSELIFGNTPKERYHRKAAIELNCTVIHPVIYSLMKKAIRGPVILAEKFKAFKYENGKVIETSETDPKAKYGIPGLLSIIDVILKQEKDGVYYKVLKEILDKYQDITISRMIVIPPGYRPYSNGKNLSVLNDIYVKLIKQVKTLSHFESNKQDKMYALRVTVIQKTVNEIFDFVSVKVPHDLRQNIEAKRVDFSARLVIIGDPSIEIGYIGVPFKVIVKIAEPFIMYEAKKSNQQISIGDLSDKIQMLSKGVKIPRQEEILLRHLTENAVSGKYVLVKRDPSLHALSWQAFKVKIVDDFTLHLNPLYVSGFNADFDGDQMAVYMPISIEAQEQCEKLTSVKTFANPYSGIKYKFDKDYSFAICFLTSDPEPKPKYWFWKKRTYKGQDTTEGRYRLFLPLEGKVDFKELNKNMSPNELLTKLSDILSQEELYKYINYMVNLSVEVLNTTSTSIDLNDLQIDPKIENQLKKLNPKSNDFPDLSNKIQMEVMKNLANGNSGLSKLFRCGVLKTTQYKQLVGTKGTVANSLSGDTMNITGNFSSGLSPTEYFSAAAGARAGVASRSIKTSIPGHLHRKLAFALASVVLDSTLDDCGTTRTLRIKITSDMESKLIGRYAYVHGKKTLLDRNLLHNLNGEVINLRSPVYCISPKVCKTCYGNMWKVLNTTQIGFVAAETLGERMVQSIMKIFHTGGATRIIYDDPLQDLRSNTGYDFKFLSYNEKDHRLKTNIDCTIKLSKEYYNFRYSNEVSLFPVDMVLGDIITNEGTFPFTIDSPVKLNLSNLTQDRTDYILSFSKDDTILYSMPQTTELEKKIKQLVSITEGRTKVYDVSHYLMKLYKNLRILGNVSLVHLEVLLSQLLRDSNDLSIPARLGKVWNPKLVSVSKIPQLESWVRGIGFERFKDGLVTSLLHNEKRTESVLDDVYFM